jgi:hypothetical protein
MACHARLNDPQPITGLGSAPVIQVLVPRLGDPPFKDGTLPSFQWAPVDAVTIVLVLGDLPPSLPDILSKAIWGVTLPPSTDHTDWKAGNDIMNGAWQPFTSLPPTNRTLYLLVEAVRPNQVVAASKPIPFRVGNPWPKPGDHCDDQNGCANPTAPDSPLYCYMSKCQLVCASHADCQSLHEDCGHSSLFDSGMRLCGLPPN